MNRSKRKNNCIVLLAGKKSNLKWKIASLRAFIWCPEHRWEKQGRGKTVLCFQVLWLLLGEVGLLWMSGFDRISLCNCYVWSTQRQQCLYIYDVCSCKLLCPNLPSLLSSRWLLRSCPAAKRGCGFGGWRSICQCFYKMILHWWN